MSTDPLTFDTHVDKWRHEQSNPWQQIKRKVALSNLLRHVDNHVLRVLDAGGGNGYDSLALAQLGHQVDIVDYSKEMIADGRLVFAANGVLDKVTYHHQTIEEIPSLFPQQQFDLLLCHNVLQYVRDVPTALRAMLSPLKRGGTLSLIAVNRYSIPYHKAFLAGDLDAALQSVSVQEFNTIFDTVAKGYSAAEMEDMLQSAGCVVRGHYGVLCIMGYWGDNERKSQPDIRDKLEKLEFALTDEYPYKLLARYIQLIGQKE
ncbi:MAG: methyltransferase domain-containing protein [Chloroflexi bacterium]|nr:methyltransferase domain-containing protein [Chloroflexota bacterium]MCL5274149.1 methyltransferase domain-containing protein [Chloroflexota bacterium]